LTAPRRRDAEELRLAEREPDDDDLDAERELAPELEPDRRERDEELREPDDSLVSPASRRCLFTVAAAIAFARFAERPFFFALCLMCSY
jgi:hypothetical protein